MGPKIALSIHGVTKTDVVKPERVCERQKATASNTTGQRASGNRVAEQVCAFTKGCFGFEYGRFNRFFLTGARKKSDTQEACFGNRYLTANDAPFEEKSARFIVRSGNLLTIVAPCRPYPRHLPNDILIELSVAGNYLGASRTPSSFIDVGCDAVNIFRWGFIRG